jgi:hypothetical protein
LLSPCHVSGFHFLWIILLPLQVFSHAASKSVIMSTVNKKLPLVRRFFVSGENPNYPCRRCRCFHLRLPILKNHEF